MPKLTLQHVKGLSYFLSGRLSVGAYIKGNRAILFDSGIDDDTAKSIEKALHEKNCAVSMIVNTHSHADHCGGNHYFQRKNPGLQIVSGKFEQHYIEEPYNEPRCFCGGSAAISELRNKHLEAQPSTVTKTITPYEDQDLLVDGETLRIVTLPGHTPGMIGVITPDNILYCGDAIFGEETYTKHGILFYTDIAKTLETFDKLAKLSIEGCVFYHGGKIDDIKPTVKAHRDKVLSTAEKIAKLVNENATTIDGLTQSVMQAFRIPDNVMQFTLTRTCVNAYVAYLQQNKRLTVGMRDSLLLVEAKQEMAESETRKSGLTM